MPERERRLSYVPLLETKANPFVNLTAGKPLSRLARAKRALVCVTLVQLRVVLTIVNVCLALLLTKIATLGLGEQDPLEGVPFAAWRNAVFTPVVWLARWQLLLLGFWHIRIKGRCADPLSAPILVANHVSGLVEGIFLLRYAKLAERSYAANPFIAPFMRATCSIFVDRSDPSSRGVAKRALLRRSVDARWPQTVVFPEGTCTNGTALVQFKQGAFAPGCPVQPVLFRYRQGSHDPSFTFPLGAAGYLGGLLVQAANWMEVEFMPVYVPTDAEARNPALYAAGVQRAMADRLQVEPTKHAAEDVALCIAAKKKGMPLEVGVVQWQAVSELLTSLRVHDAVRIMGKFRAMDKEGRGRIDFATFTAAMRSQARSGSIDFAEPCSPERGGEQEELPLRMSSRPEIVLSDEDLRTVFNLLDIHGDGEVDFQEYLCGVAVLNGWYGEEQAASLKWTFDCLAKGQDHFTKEQLDGLLCRAVPNLEGPQLAELFKEADQNADGIISREEFIAFALKHREDLGLRASRFLAGLPIPFDSESRLEP